MFDQNRDGEITKEELGAVLYALGQRPTVTEVQALIRSVDLDSKYRFFCYFPTIFYRISSGRSRVFFFFKILDPSEKTKTI